MVEHLDELRVRLFRIIAFLAVGVIAGWFVAMDLYWLLEGVVKANMPEDVPYKAVITTLPGAFMLRLKMSAYIGVFVTLPFTVHQLWGFIAPGLRKNERRPVGIVAPISSLLFLVGVGTCWFILPATVYWFASFNAEMRDTQLLLEAGTMVFLLINMMLSFGIGFQMPLVVFFLARLEIITPQAMMKYWRHAVVGVIIASAIITPSGDPLSLSVMAVPLIALFFLSVFAARYTLRKKKSEEEELDELD